MSDDPKTTAVYDLGKGLLALYLEVPQSVGASIVRLVDAALDEVRVVERERCAEIVERHPNEAHPAIFDPEEVRGCCEVMAARIRSGE